MWHKINSRGHHGRSCHYWSGNSSSCTSALVSGNKLMWCRQKPFLPLVGVCWVCNVLAQSSQKQQDGFIMCYHLQQLGCFISWDSALLHFHRPSPVFWWIFDDEGAGPHLDLDERRLFFLKQNKKKNIHISQCHRVTCCDLSDPSSRTFLSIIVIVLLMLVGDVMVWSDHHLTLTAISAGLSSRVPHVSQSPQEPRKP